MTGRTTAAPQGGGEASRVENSADDARVAELGGRAEAFREASAALSNLKEDFAECSFADEAYDMWNKCGLLAFDFYQCALDAEHAATRADHEDGNSTGTSGATEREAQ